MSFMFLTRIFFTQGLGVLSDAEFCVFYWVLDTDIIYSGCSKNICVLYVIFCFEIV